MAFVQIESALTSFLIAFITVPLIIKYSLRNNLVDIPGRRKIHKRVKPSMGGIAIFSGFLISSVIYAGFLGNTELKFIIASVSIVFLLGIVDDTIHLPAVIKLMGQLIALSLIILLLDVRIKSLYSVGITTPLPFLISYLMTIFTMVIITNSFNLIDGLDGLAGSVSAVALLCFGVWFYLTDDKLYSLLSFSLLGGVCAFLLFNWQPSKIFMGDTGSLVLGMMLAVFSVRFIDLNNNLPVQHAFKFQSSIATPICFMIVPIVDTARIISLRLYRRKSLFAPDKNHIHHTIVRLGKSHSQTTLILIGFQLIYITLAVTFRQLSDFYLLSAVISVSVLLSVTLDRLIINKLSA